MLASTSLEYERQAQQLSEGPDVVGEACGHGGRLLPIATLQTRHFQTQRLMCASKVVKASPPMNVCRFFWHRSAFISVVMSPVSGEYPSGA
jgi:hypothetical protein